MRLPRVFEPLRHRDFRLLWTGQTLTIFGSFISNVAYPFQVLQLGGGAVELAVLVSVFAAATLAFLLVGGAVADRFPRRTLIVATETLSGVVAAIVGILGFGGRLEIWHLYVAYGWAGIATAFSMPALGAIIPELVPEEILVAGNAVQGLSRQAGRIGGPIVGGILVATAGPAAAFVADAISFFLSAGAVALTRSRPAAEHHGESIVAQIREGIAFVFSVQWLWVTIFGFSLIVALIIGSYAVALPLLVTDVLHGDSVTFGIVTAVFGIGEAAGAAWIAQVKIRRIGVAMYLFAALSGVGFLIYGLVLNVPGALVAGVVNGVAFTCFGVLWQTALQVHVPRRLLGRVTSVDWFGGSLLAPVAPVGAALVVEAVGPPAVFVATGVVTIVLCLAALLLPSIRDLE
jgi:MFS family permease